MAFENEFLLEPDLSDIGIAVDGALANGFLRLFFGIVNMWMKVVLLLEAGELVGGSMVALDCMR